MILEDPKLSPYPFSTHLELQLTLQRVSCTSMWTLQLSSPSSIHCPSKQLPVGCLSGLHSPWVSRPFQQGNSGSKISKAWYRREHSFQMGKCFWLSWIWCKISHAMREGHGWMRAQEGSLKCVAKVGTPLLKYKSNSDNPFPYGCCLPLNFSLMYYNSAKCLKSLHGSRFTSVFISASNECLSHLLLSLHLILVLFLFFYLLFFIFLF